MEDSWCYIYSIFAIVYKYLYNHSVLIELEDPSDG